MNYQDKLERLINGKDGLIFTKEVEEAGIPRDAKLCACTQENSGVVKVMEAEYKHDLSDVPKEVLQILKSQGVSLKKLNESLMTEEIIYGK